MFLSISKDVFLSLKVVLPSDYYKGRNHVDP